MPAPVAASSPRRLPWIIAALAVFAAICLGLQAYWWRQQFLALQTERALTEVALKMLQGRFDERTFFAEGLINDLRRQLAGQQDLTRLRVISLSPAANNPSSASAVVILDPARNTGLMVAENLPLAAGAQAYHLWLIASTGTPPSDAGTVLPAADGRALLTFGIPAGTGPDARFGLGPNTSGSAEATPGAYLLMSR